MVLFDEQDSSLLKKWIVQRLEDISDADADVLADYVLALLRNDQGENEVRQTCTDQLADFLQEHTNQFVDDVFNAINTKGYRSVNSTLAGAAHAPPPQQPEQPAAPSSSSLLNSTPLFAGSASTSTLSAAAAPYVPRSPGRGTPRSRERSRSPEDMDMDASRSRGGAREREPLSMDRDSHYSNDGMMMGRDGGGGGGGVGGGGYRQRRGGRNDDGRGGRWPRGGGDRNNRGGWRGNDRGNFGGQQHQQHQQQHMGQGYGQQQGGMPGMQMPGMQGMPWGQDPMSQFLAAQASAAAAAAMGWPPGSFNPQAPQQGGGFPPAPVGPQPGSPVNRKVPKQWGKRCRDYDNQGFCVKGDMCPYEHGGVNPLAAQQQGERKDDEYDPNNSMLPQMINQQGQGQDQSRGRGRGGRAFRGGRGGQRGGRSEFSSTTNHERRNVPLVVENIPDDKLNDASVREFFGQFGNIEGVEFKQGRNMATLKFQTFEMAKSAFESPAPIFDNRFVKVFWLKQDQNAGGYNNNGMQGGADAGGAGGGGGDDMEMIDEAEFAKKQEEAQKAYDEKQAKKKANEELAKDLERRKEELVKQQQEQKRLLLEKLAKKHAEAAAVANTEETAVAGDAKSEAEAKKTAALKAQLEALEAEAASLGIDHSKLDQPLTDGSSYRGRGAYRGARGAYPYRGAASYSPYRATRGGFGFTRGRVMNKLDNRTKKIAVAGVDSAHDEELRQYLLLNSEFESIDPHPSAGDSQIISFKDRATAEKFMYTGKEIPGIGKVELTWYNPSGGGATGSGVGSPMPAANKADDVEMGGDAGANVEPSGMDEFDVAEDDERRWG